MTTIIIVLLVLFLLGGGWGILAGADSAPLFSQSARCRCNGANRMVVITNKSERRRPSQEERESSTR
jgi:hypothetical protein